jgi:hypothetical protein
MNYHNGPFRYVIIENNNWTPRDTLAWITDGTSNQIFVGEKHIPKNKIGRCDENGVSTWADDCSYLAGGHIRAIAVGRTVYVFNYSTYPAGVVRNVPLWGPDYERDSEGAVMYYGFGSPHPGICNFVMGDGAVRSLSITTVVDPILKRLGKVNDGESVTIP